MGRRDACAVRCGHRWVRWGLLAGAGLYLLGRRERPEHRLAAVQAMDQPELADTWARLSQLPQFRVMRQLVMRRALAEVHRVRVLDIGCGTGQLTRLLARQAKVSDAVGIDLAEPLLKQARQAAEEEGVHAEFLQVDGAEMPFPDASFDVVVSTLSLHHWQRPQAVIREITRVLAPGGRAVIFDLRRDAPTLFWGAATVATRYLLPSAIRAAGEPLASLKSAYTPWEAALLAHKAGAPEASISTGPIWMIMEWQQPA